jgi:uncharacterized protein (UPF0264 family)
MTELLVSVRSVEEAEAALIGGAGLIDVKEPSRGSLGRADEDTIAAVVRAVNGRWPVSAALGELRETSEALSVCGLSYVKWGLAGCGSLPDWRTDLLRAAAPLGCRRVAVAYADWRRASAPPPEQVAAFATEHGCGAFLLDTWRKDGTTLLDWLPVEDIVSLARGCRRGDVAVALAGSLSSHEFDLLHVAEPTWFAVRGAACRSGQREQMICAERVRQLAQSLRAGGS